MKLEEWREIELILMAQPIHFFHFHQSSLPNGKIDWEMKRNDGQWAPREWMNQWNWWFHSIGCGICLICLALLFLMNGGLWAVAPPMAPPRRENKQTKPNESKKWSWRIEKIVNGAEASNKAKSIYWVCCCWRAAGLFIFNSLGYELALLCRTNISFHKSNQFVPFQLSCPFTFTTIRQASFINQ